MPSSFHPNEWKTSKPLWYHSSFCSIHNSSDSFFHKQHHTTHYSAKSINAVFTAPSPSTSFPCFKIRTRLTPFPSIILFHNPSSSASSTSRGTIPISTKSDRITSHTSPSSFRINTKSPCFTEISSPFPTLHTFSHSYFFQNRVSQSEPDSLPRAARSESRNSFV